MVLEQLYERTSEIVKALAMTYALTLLLRLSPVET